MPEQEGGYVALFIDWDNLAISTAADHGGAPPDLRRIVQVAQSYGTLLIARAYAEWGVTSERLNVYRAGVEPVYAPTFRFSEDGPGRPAGGKSLADPCLVSDCIDMLHLHPQLTTLVLVSGDKDLIPIVRLAQMRGKKVVVIGPDLVAAVLKDMADEYIAYRSLLGGDAARSAIVRAEAAELGRRRRRRGGRGRGGAAAEGDAETPEQRAEPKAPGLPPAPGLPRPLHRERRPFADRAALPRPEPPAEPVEEVPTPPALGEPTRVEPRVEPMPERAEVPPPPDRPAPAEGPGSQASPEELSELYATIQTILRERTNAGRPRLRATNLKDHLIARKPGFNERKYGFSSFRDLLAAARAASVLQITDVGQVQWISLPDVQPESGGTQPAPPAQAPAPPATERAPAIELAEALQAIVEMQHHTKLLTPTYVTSTLSNLINARSPGYGSEDAQRLVEALTRSGAIRVDTEPQEVEVDGAKHRVRLVHLVEENPEVQRAEQARQQRNGASATREGSAEVTEAAPEPAANGRNSSRRSRRGRGGSKKGAGDEAGEAVAAEPPAAEPTAESPLDQVFATLVDAVRASIPPGRDTAGAAGVKSRLSAALPSFDEKQLGFSKFKDFLLAAEKAGKVRVETSGAATRVGLPG
ncbi:MAG TPA: NYN domain-containing protein [Chloroflexota bacterium]|nr:NYN domain-containing protein [Chloroflexota bacterium]